MKYSLTISFHHISHLEAKNQILQLSKVGCTITSDRIPSGSGIPSGTGHNTGSCRLRLSGLGVVAITSNGVTTSDVSQHLWSILVNKRVQPSQAWLASSETGIVEQTDNGSPNRSSSTGTSACTLLTSIDNLIVGRDTVSSNIREASAFPVGVRAVVLLCLLGDSLHVRFDSLVLVAGSGEVLAETTRRTFPGDFGGDINGTADGGEVRAGGREDGVELDSLVVRAETSSTNADIARGEDDTDSSKSEKTNQVAGHGSIFARDAL